MTAVEWLEDKINDELEIYNNQWLLIENFIEQAKEMEKESQDDFAIGFADWYEFTLRESDNLNERFTPKQLIEMFKKEKEL